ncbi:MAG TPA: hypothetical protein VMW48_14420, partial [Vicinamibacterales bacterium]|nr:hypothetical protein [Vicinamibacterales bacterium]
MTTDRLPCPGARVVAAALLAAACVSHVSAQSATAPQAHDASGGRVITLPRPLEIRLAVNALPQSLRDDATVLV